MPRDVLMPQLSPTMTEGRLASWLVKEGDVVSAGDIIAEVETDKATMEVEATDDGVVHQLIGTVGADIPVGSPIAVMKNEGEEVPADYTPVGKGASSAAPAETAAAPVQAAAPTTSAEATSSERIKASPLARRVAEQTGVNLAVVEGSGPHGRVIKKDVEQAKASGTSAAPAAKSAATLVFIARAAGERGADEMIRLTPMRKAIAARLTQSKQQVPHFYLTASANMDALLEMRKQLNELGNGQVKLTVNDFIVKACALGLAKYPQANASWTDEGVLQYGNVDIAVAVSIDGGLITPIVKNADRKGLAELSAEVKSLAGRAREGALKPEEFQGGSFSLSNLGMYGVKNFQAIINPPQAAILAVGAAEERVVVKNGQQVVSSIMDMSLSVDHRVIDGALGAELLQSIKFYLENPLALVM